MKCMNCEKCEKCKDDTNEWCDLCKTCKQLSHYCKECKKIYNDCECCLELKEVRKKYLIFDCQKCEKDTTIPSEYHISKFPDLSTFCGIDLEKFVLLLRKSVICYEFIDSQ